jgi:micrococcal nuclease
VSSRAALFWLCVLAAVVLAGEALQRSGGDSAGGPSGGGGLAARPGQTLTARVTRVVDGDTVHVRGDGGGEETVRYIGVDTPESVKPGTPVQCYAKAASHRNAQLVDAQPVRLVVGAEARDRYGRLLAYVYRVADGRFVNETLVDGGFARTLTIPPNDRYAARFAARAAAARQAGRGLWGAC